VNCLTVYDEQVGDALAGVVAGTKFSDLPAGYVCHVCGAGVGEFEKRG
jgi:rubredoxin